MALPMVTDTGKYTEADLLVLLKKKLTASGNGGNGEYAVIGGVRNDAGFQANRTFDAVAVSLWPSRGLRIHVYEIKVSRSDWQRELKKPDKAEDACKVADYFSVIAPKGIVQTGELPPTWGLLEVVGTGDTQKLRTTVAAPLLHPERSKAKPPPLDRGFVVGMLRSLPGAVPGGRLPPLHQSELDAAYQRGLADRKQDRYDRLQQLEHLERDVKALREALAEAGVDSYNTGVYRLTELAPQIADAIHGAKLDARLDSARDALRNALAALGG